MDEASKGQVNRSAAEVYEDFFVPALFRGAAVEVANAARLHEGQSVLDVACGTGVLAREAAGRVGAKGRVSGLDRNDGMLAVARAKAPGIDWRQGLAEKLPFPDESFDAVVSQFGLMFFEDRGEALHEMRRVLKTGGTLAVAVWDKLEHSPGYAALAALLRRLFGARVAGELHAPFVLGDAALLRSLAADAGIRGAEIKPLPVTVRFPSLDAWLHTEVKGWTLADMIDEAQYQTLLGEARKDLAAYVERDGTVAFACPALLATARKN